MAREIVNDDLKREPYLDRFNPEDERTRVLFNFDRGVQNGELNEMQSMQDYAIENLGNSVMSGGDVQDGMDFTITNDYILTVESGMVYVNGKIRYFSEQSIQLDGEGMEYVGVDVLQEGSHHLLL